MALLMVMTICLLVYAALEQSIRSKLKAHNATFPNQQGKQTQNPTAKWVFNCFVGIHLLIVDEKQRMILNLNERQRSLLDLLGEGYWHFYT